ncbi:MAG: hypothetical protein JST42_27740 [Bacteroidetes bacterium]|nr:hypothetical protein [Bacteroidota bacterium]
MDLLRLLKDELFKDNKDRIVAYIGRDKERFARLIQLFFRGDYRIAQRAAWPLSYCVQNHPELITPWFRQLLDNLDRKDIHPAVVRNTIRLLQDVDIPKKYHGQVMNKCFDLVQSPGSPIAVKAFSLTVLSNLSADYPEIAGELKLIIEDQWDQASPAFRSRAKRVLKKMER